MQTNPTIFASRCRLVCCGQVPTDCRFVSCRRVEITRLQFVAFSLLGDFYECVSRCFPDPCVFVEF